MKYKIIILLFLFSVLLYCSSTKKDFTVIKEEVEQKETFERKDVHKGLEGNFLFYVSGEDSEGDIWLYNLNK